MGRKQELNPWRLAHLGFELAGAVVVMTLIGWWFDWQFGTGPWGLVVGAILGGVGGMYLFILEALKVSGEQERQRREAGRPGAGGRERGEQADRGDESD